MMSQKESEKFAKKLDDAENTARIHLFKKASKKYHDLIKTAQELEPSMVDDLYFLSALYAVNHDISENKDPIETESLQNLYNLQKTMEIHETLPMVLHGGFFGDYSTDRIIKEVEALLLMDNGLSSKNPEFLEKAADLFMEIGSAQLFFSRYVRPIGRRVTGNKAALECEAGASKIKGDAVADPQPNAAIPHYMLATRALRAARRYREESEVRAKLIGMRMTRRCWFCGRLVQGANHFTSLHANVTKYFENLLVENKEDLRVCDENMIYVCMPCASAVSNEAEKRARLYYDDAMRCINRLTSEVQALKSLLSRVT
jgi:hypothetical protein